MKVLPFIIPKPEQAALVYQEDHELVFYDKFHQHEEIQISLIVEGEGTLIVGDTINYYKAGDVLVIGSNLPHVFKSDLKKEKKSHMLTLFFTEDAFGNDFFKLEELKELLPFFKRASHGFKISTPKKDLNNLFLKLKSASKLAQFILLLEILKIVSKQSYKSLSSFIYEKKYNDLEGKRMRDVMEYTMNNFHKDITLDKIATIAAMTKNAFCKYFKKRTNKTYFRFLNELKIESACKLLLANEDYTISEIADKSGFNNISNFNRQFKSFKRISPKAFKKNNVIN
ncbi:helix-turn-helix domain-containing protein [Flavobacteriaceae bacterium AU392]|nr:AraC family transcriptional regulator [Flavobacteriaceae bacterium]RKM84167.1 helix-turn-helix domain-containing protein [Flavobacteriaceae bacterium AU392]